MIFFIQWPSSSSLSSSFFSLLLFFSLLASGRTSKLLGFHIVWTQVLLASSISSDREAKESDRQLSSIVRCVDRVNRLAGSRLGIRPRVRIPVVLAWSFLSLF